MMLLRRFRAIPVSYRVPILVALLMMVMPPALPTFGAVGERGPLVGRDARRRRCRAQNVLLHTVDQFNPDTQDTKILSDREKMVTAVRAYRSGPSSTAPAGGGRSARPLRH